MKSLTIDYRYITALDDATLQQLITAHRLISNDVGRPNIRAELAAIRIFASFAWGIKRWDDGLRERSQVEEERQFSEDGGGVDEGHAILDRLVEALREEDRLLSDVLRECVKVGWEE